jgi:anti-sigma B factor antagonist
LSGTGASPHAGRNVKPHKEGIMEIRQRLLGSVVCVDVNGRLVVGVENGLKDKVNSLFLQGHRDILLNFKDVSQIDTSGLAAITAVRCAAKMHGGTIKLLNLPPRVHNLLVITKLITMFDVFESEGDAVRSFPQAADV